MSCLQSSKVRILSRFNVMMKSVSGSDIATLASDSTSILQEYLLLRYSLALRVLLNGVLTRMHASILITRIMML